MFVLWVLSSLAFEGTSLVKDWHLDVVTGREPRSMPTGDDLPFASRRSPVVCRNGCVASSQPLASSIGLDLLRRGANAAEAAVGVAAALAVTEPCSTGLGGDMFCLYYDSRTRKVSAINGSGRSPASFTLELLKEIYPDGSGGVDREAFRFSPHSVTVPGAARGWEDLIIQHGSGKLTFSQLLEPAVQLAKEGFPVAPVTAYHWKACMPQITKWVSRQDDIPFTVDGKRPPEVSHRPNLAQRTLVDRLQTSHFALGSTEQAGEIFVNADLADVLSELGSLGASQGFYNGRVGKAIEEAIQRQGGRMTEADLSGHSSTFPDPIYAEFRGYKLWEVPPNGQGVAALIALSALQHLEQTNIITPISAETIGSADTYHALIEVMRLGFADARAHVGDPKSMTVDTEWLLDTTRVGQEVERRFRPSKANIDGAPDAGTGTVSFQVVDQQGNAVSFVNSNYLGGFGSGIVPSRCGFSLHNRGFGFALQKGHPNVAGPSKRPCHTILPGILTHSDTNELYATISNQGCNMHPQGHLQLSVNLLAGRMDPQAAIDQPRFCIFDGSQGGKVYFERGMDKEVLDDLGARGHERVPDISGHGKHFIFGRAQIIQRDRQTGVLWAGSDGRADGCAMGY